MNVIIAYLETMFSAYPQTPRMLEAKAELQTMMEDAYTSLRAEGRSENEAIGAVISDFGNLEEIAPVLGIAGEIAPAASAPGAGATGAGALGDPPAGSGLAGSGAGSAAAAGSANAANPAPFPARPTPRHPAVTLEEAEGFAEAHRSTRFNLATAVALFVVAVIPLIVLPASAQAGVVALDQNVAAVVGLLALFVLVAVGVTMIIGVSREFAPYSRLREGHFSGDPAVASWADGLAQQHERRRITALQVAVLCWVLSPVPVLLLSLLTDGSPLQGVWSVVGVALTLLVVALGLLVLLPATWAHTAAETLRKGGSGAAPADVYDDEDGPRSLLGVIAAFYWPLLTAIYLAWSFIGNAWGDSWILWPIGAVLFAALAAGTGAWESYRRNRGGTR